MKEEIFRGRRREACARGEDGGSVAVVLQAQLQMKQEKKQEMDQGQRQEDVSASGDSGNIEAGVTVILHC